MDISKQSYIIFDYDGTLHESLVLYKAAFIEAYKFLVERVPQAVLEAGYTLDKEWSDQEISQWLGYNKDDMWALFMPNLSPSLKEKCGRQIGERMTKLLLEGNGVLYKGAVRTLNYLRSKGYKLIFLSNCSESYMQTHREIFGLDTYFDVFACAGQYKGYSKAEILSDLILQDAVHLQKGVQHYMVGDRAQDVELANIHALEMIACDYGYSQDGELDCVKRHIQRIIDLIDLL